MLQHNTITYFWVVAILHNEEIYVLREDMLAPILHTFVGRLRSRRWYKKWRADFLPFDDNRRSVSVKTMHTEKLVPTTCHGNVCTSHRNTHMELHNLKNFFLNLYTLFDKRRLDTIDQVEYMESTTGYTDIYPLCELWGHILIRICRNRISNLHT